METVLSAVGLTFLGEIAGSALIFVITRRRRSRKSKIGDHAETQVSETITSLESGGKICPSCGFTNSYLTRNFCEKCGTALQQTETAGSETRKQR